MTIEGGRATVSPAFASLTDHSIDPPCSSPSPTNPNSLPPRHEPTAFASAGSPIDTTAINPSAASTEITIAAGTAQGVTEGETVTTAPSPGAPHGQLVGIVDPPGPTTSTVRLVTSPYSTIPVALDAGGDDAVLLGRGSGQPVQAELVNRALTLRVGTRLLTTGAPGSPVVGGIPAGTISRATTHDAVPNVLVTPGFSTADLDHLVVTETPAAAS